MKKVQEWVKDITRSFRQKDSSARMVALMSSATLFNNVLTIVAGLLVARWLLPEDLGLFNSFSIITSYIILAQAGVPSGLSRQYPYFIGRGDKDLARSYASVANFWSLFLSALVFAVCSFVAIFFLLQKNYAFAAGTFIIGVTSFDGFYISKYLQILFRSTNDFNKLSRINLAIGFVNFISIFFVLYFGFYGLCLRAIVVTLTKLILTWRYKPVHAMPKWDKQLFRELFKIGMPIYMVATAYSLWPIFQRSIVLAIGGTKALGLFGLALMVETASNTITSSVSNIVFPRMAAEWAKTKNFSNLVRIVRKPIAATLLINSVAALAGWYILPVFILELIPAYTESIPVARWSLIVGLMMVVSVYSSVYMIIQRNMDRLKTYITGFVVWLGAIYILNYIRGFNLVNFPQAMCIAYVGIYFTDFIFYLKYKKTLP